MKKNLARTLWATYTIKTLLALFLFAGLALVYTSSLVGVSADTIKAYRSLKTELTKQGYDPNLFVLSGRRYWLDNKLLSTLGGASRDSRHLRGDAIDIVVMDINGDGEADRKDVDLVYETLERKIIGDSGGIGTYKNENDFFSRQMVHFDLRGHRARWNR